MRNYYPPEVLEDRNSMTFFMDIWAIGVLIYKLLFRKDPYQYSNKDTD